MAIILNDNIQANLGKPIENKYLEPTLNRPYTGISEVNTTIVEALRYEGLTVNINNEEYWYENGVGDGDLVVKTGGGASTNVTGVTNGLNLSSGLVGLGGTLTGDTTVDTNSNGIVFGNSSTATGTNSFSTGYGSQATGATSVAMGYYAYGHGANSVALGYGAKAYGDRSVSIGRFTCSFGYQTVTIGNGTKAYGFNSHAEGLNTIACNNDSHAEGNNTLAFGNRSHAQGQYTVTSGCTSHAGGLGDSTKKLISFGHTSFNHSRNTALQTVGHGALADNSAILGGLNHNIESGNVRAAIIGGDAIKLTGTSYIDTTAVANLAIMTAPSAGGSDDVLTYDSLGRVTKVTQASIAAQAATTANNGITLVGSNFVLGGTLTGDTNILTDSNGFSIGYSNIATGSSSIALGHYSKACGDYSIAIGRHAYAHADTSVATGYYSHAYGVNSFVAGYSTTCGSFAFAANNSHAIANGSTSFGGGCATGNYAFAIGGKNSTRTIAGGDRSFVGGCGEIIASGNTAFNFSHRSTPNTSNHGAIADQSAILGGTNHNIEAGNVRAAIIGGNDINLTGSSYADHTAVDNLAIWSTPTDDADGEVLVWDSATKKVGKTTIAALGGLSGATNGLSTSGNDVILGGTLDQTTTINGDGNILTIENASQISLQDNANMDLSVTGASGLLDVNAKTNAQIVVKSQSGTLDGDDFTNGIGFNLDYNADIFSITDNRATAAGIQYVTDYSLNYTDRSLVDKAYVDAIATGLDAKQASVVATTVSDGNIDLTGGTFSSGSTIDNIAVEDGWRVLIKNQTDAVENGIYDYSASASGFTRSEDFDGNPVGEVSQGSFTFIVTGDTLASTSWLVTTPDPIVVGTTEIEFTIASRSFDLADGTGTTVTIEGSNRAVSVELAPNSGMDFDSASAAGRLRLASSVAGQGVSLTSGVLSANITDATVVGSEIAVKSDTGGADTLFIDSSDLPTANVANGLSLDGAYTVLGGTLTGATTINTDSGFGVAIGRGTVAASGTDGFAQGYNAQATGDYSLAMGYNAITTGNSSITIGHGSCAIGTYSNVIGRYSKAIGDCSSTIGTYACAEGTGSLAIGYSARACNGYGSLAVGYFATTRAECAVAVGYAVGAHGLVSSVFGVKSSVAADGFGSVALGTCNTIFGSSTGATGVGHKTLINTTIGGIAIGGGVPDGSGTRRISVCGNYGINLSHNTVAQTNGHGVLAAQSTILGGIDANIASTSTGTTLLGGTAVKITGTDYVDSVVIPDNLALLTAPSAGTTGDTLLVRDGSTGVVKEVTQGSITGQVSVITANNGLTKDSNDTIVLGGALTGTTTINTNTGYGFAVGRGTVEASGVDSFAFGCAAKARGDRSIAFAYSTADGDDSIAFGKYSYGRSGNTIAIGTGNNACSTKAVLMGMYNTVSTGDNSIAIGYSNVVRNQRGVALGYGNTICSDDSVGIGFNSSITSDNSVAIGSRSSVAGGSRSSVALGHCGKVCANVSGGTAIGSYTNVCNGVTDVLGGIAIGTSLDGAKRLIVSNNYGVNISHNTAAQTAGHGVNAVRSTILGGIDNNIAATSTGTTLLGGTAVKITGTDYVDSVVIPDNLALLTAPSAGTTGDTILVRDGSTGVVKEVTQGSITGQVPAVTAINGLSVNGSGDVVLGGTLTGDTTINNSTNNLIFGSIINIGTGSTNNMVFGDNSFIGDDVIDNFIAANCSGYHTGIRNVAMGCRARTYGTDGVAIGFRAIACGIGSFAGNRSYAHGDSSAAFAFGCAYGSGSFAAAYGTACGVGSFAGNPGSLANGNNSAALAEGQALGYGSFSVGKSVLASGDRTIAMGSVTENVLTSRRVKAIGDDSVIISTNNNSAPVDGGANAAQSTILGGLNHNIGSGNIRATIVGGNTINLTGSTYVDHTVVGDLAIISSPAVGTVSDSVLVRDSSNGIIKAVAGSELGDANNVYDVTAVTTTTLTANEYVVLVQTSGGTQTVTLPASPVDGQAYKIKDRGNALSNAITIAGNGNNIDGSSTASINTDYGALEVVYSSDADEWFTLAFIN